MLLREPRNLQLMQLFGAYFIIFSNRYCNKPLSLSLWKYQKVKDGILVAKVIHDKVRHHL